MSKYIILNSGGFDSVTMAHLLVRESFAHKDIEWVNLFFHYYQPNVKKEISCSKKCAEELGMKHMEIALNKFSWTKHGFYAKDPTDGYLEYRNLIFLSFAVSIAESIGATKIFMADYHVDGCFKDCGRDFIENFNKTIAPSGIEVIVPFAYLCKDEIASAARRLEITSDDFFSCNCPKETPEGFIPCGECGDCQNIKSYGLFPQTN